MTKSSSKYTKKSKVDDLNGYNDLNVLNEVKNLNGEAKKFNNNLYIGISIFSIFIMIVIFIVTYYIYKNALSSFSDYDPYSNPNIVTSGKNGLQYVIDPNNAYISTSSNGLNGINVYTNKENMIDKALTSINSTGAMNGYVTPQPSSSYLNYIIIILVALLLIGIFTAYATYYESKNS